jgi:hypothetical protein
MTDAIKHNCSYAYGQVELYLDKNQRCMGSSFDL